MDMTRLPSSKKGAKVVNTIIHQSIMNVLSIAVCSWLACD